MNDSFHCNFPFSSLFLIFYLFLFPLNSADGSNFLQNFIPNFWALGLKNSVLEKYLCFSRIPLWREISFKSSLRSQIFLAVYLIMKNNLNLNSCTYNKYIKIPTQNNLREDEIRGATSIIGFLLSLIPVSDISCNRLCDKGHSLENYVFFSCFRWTQPYSFLCLFPATTSSLWEKRL